MLEKQLVVCSCTVTKNSCWHSKHATHYFFLFKEKQIRYYNNDYNASVVAVNVPILTCPKYNLILTLLEVNEVNNEIHNLHNLLYFKPKMCISIYLFEPKFQLLYSNRNCTVSDEAVSNMGKALQFYTSSSMVISGNSAVGLLVIAFFYKRDTLSAKITLSRPSTS